MSIVGQIIRKERNKRKWKQEDLGRMLGVSGSAIGMYERGERNPDNEMLSKFADIFGVKVDYLLGRTKDPHNGAELLSSKDERDIQKELQKMIEDLNSQNSYAAFDGQTINELDEEDRELLIASLENSLRLAKRLAKQKFTPKKYRK